MSIPKAMEYGRRKASPDVLKPHTYVYIVIYVEKLEKQTNDKEIIEKRFERKWE